MEKNEIRTPLSCLPNDIIISSLIMPNTWDSTYLLPSPYLSHLLNHPQARVYTKSFPSLSLYPTAAVTTEPGNPDFSIKSTAPCSSKIHLLQALIGSNKAKMLRGYFWMVGMWVDVIFFLVLFCTLNLSIENSKQNVP